GKTTVVANLGFRLALLGFKVVIVDSDLGLNNLDVVMGIENKVVYDIVDVIEGRCAARRALIEIEDCPNLFIMPSAHSYDKSYVTGQNLRVVTERLSETFDYVLVDCPAGIERGFHRAVSAVTEAIIVTTPDISSVKDASKVVKMLGAYDMKIAGLVINKVRGDLIMSGDMMNVDEIVALLGVNPIGILPDDDVVGIHSAVGLPITSGSGIFDAFAILGQNLHFGENLNYDCTKRYRGVFGKFRRDIKRRV
ncbi:MAG: septum site-determining protein MinD, partial [Clostridia bacterium]